MDPASDRLARRPNPEGGGGLVTWATSQLDIGETCGVQTSLASEASDWLEARNTLAGSIPRLNPGEPTETKGLESPTAEVDFDERQMT